MTAKRRQHMMYATCGLAILWGLYMQPWKSSDSRGSGPKNPYATATVATTEAAPQVSVQAADIGSFATGRLTQLVEEWGADPFRPIHYEQDEDEIVTDGPVEMNHNAPVLNGMMNVGGVASCVLNGRVCKVGDQFKSWRVIAITPDGVLVQDPSSQPVTLRMVSRSKKKGANNE